MSADDPVRIVDEASDASPRLRELFGAGREELPAPEQLESLAARLGPLLGPAGGGPHGGGGGGGGVAATAKLGVGLAGATKAALAIATLAVAGVGVGVWATRPPRDEVRTAPPRTSAVTTDRDRPPVRAPTIPSPAPSPTAPVAPPAVALPAAPRLGAPRAAVRTAPSPVPAPVAPAVAAPAPTEWSLVDPAQREVRTSPARALELAEQHARRFPTGTFAQEREMIAIEALVRLGRRAEATARAARFHESFPGSSHGRRVDVLVATPE